MNTTRRIIEFVLHGDADKFKAVLKEEITNRTTNIIENLYLEEAKCALMKSEIKDKKQEKTEQIKEISTFYPEKAYYLKDGNIGILDKNERDLVSKLYENLNNDNKDRLLKLLSESQETFNRVLKLAKLEEKRNTNE